MRMRAGTLMASLLSAIALIAPAPPAVAAGMPTRGFVFDSNGNTFSAFDPGTNTITDRVGIGIGVSGLAVRPDGEEVWFSDFFGGRIAVLATATHRVVATITAGRPSAPAFTPDSRTAYVATTRPTAVIAIDTASRQVTAVIPLPDEPHNLAVSPDGARVYVGTDAAAVLSRNVVVIDTATNQIVGRVPMPQNRSNHDVYVTPDSRFALLDGGDVIDTRTLTVGRTMNWRFRASDVAFTPDSRAAYAVDFCGAAELGVVRLWDLGTGQLLDTTLTGGSPTSVALTSDGSRLYVVLGEVGGIAVIDTATKQRLDTFGLDGPNHVPLLGQVELSETAPAPQGPGQRFAPVSNPSRICIH
jgi:DNA-binding beta-propeller fold protein YncE